MTGLVGLNDVRAAVQAAMGTHNKTWKDSMWSDFIKDVVSFLVDEKSEDPDNVVEAAVGLIVYGATTQEKLQGVGQREYAEFKRQLTADKYGVPAAICDMLFGEYVAPAQALHTGARKRSLEEAAASYDDCVRGAVWSTMGHLTAGVPAIGALFNVTLMGEAGLGEEGGGDALLPEGNSRAVDVRGRRAHEPRSRRLPSGPPGHGQVDGRVALADEHGRAPARARRVDALFRQEV